MKAVKWFKVGNIEFSRQGKQPHLTRDHYYGWDLAEGFWWHCFRLPSDCWLWMRRYKRNYVAPRLQG